MISTDYYEQSREIVRKFINAAQSAPHKYEAGTWALKAAIEYIWPIGYDTIQNIEKTCKTGI